MKVGDVVTFVGAPEVKMAVSWAPSSGEQALTCIWMRDGAFQAGTFPEACLTLVRPGDPETMGHFEASVRRMVASTKEWVAKGDAVAAYQTLGRTVVELCKDGVAPPEGDEGRMRILRRVAELAQFARGHQERHGDATRSLLSAALEEILSDEGWQ